MATSFKLFNMTFADAASAFDFFCIPRQTPLAACRQPEAPRPLSFAATLSDYSLIGSSLYWHRAENLFALNDADGNGLNSFDGEYLRHLALIEGVAVNGDTTPLLAQFLPEEGMYLYYPLTTGVHCFKAIDHEGDERSLTIVVSPDQSVWTYVVSPRDAKAVQALAWQILHSSASL